MEWKKRKTKLKEATSEERGADKHNQSTCNLYALQSNDQFQLVDGHDAPGRCAGC